MIYKRGIQYFLLLVVAVLLMCNCSPDDSTPKDVQSAKKASIICRNKIDSTATENILLFIDSFWSNTTPSAEREYQIYSLKNYVFQNKLFNYNMASLYADSMLWCVKNLHQKWDSADIFFAYRHKGEALYSLEQYEKAYIYYDSAREISLKYKSEALEANYLFRMGVANYKEEHYLKAAHLFNASAKKFKMENGKPFDDVFKQQQTLSNIGLAYSKVNMPDSALFYYQEARKFIITNMAAYPIKIVNWHEALSVIYGNIGSMYISTGQKDSAEKYFIRSIELNKQIDRNPLDRQYNQIKLANLYITQGKYKEARTILEEQTAAAKSNPKRLRMDDSLELAARSSEAYWKYYYAIGKYKEAIDYQDIHHATRQAKWERTQKMITNSLEKGINNAAHEKQINSLEKDVEIKKQAALILVLIVIICLGTAFAIFYLLKKYKKNYSSLKIKNENIIINSNIQEEKLQRKINTDRANYLALLENTEDFLWSVDTEYNLLAFNKAYRERMLELAGKCPEIGRPDVFREKDPVMYEKIKKSYQIALTGIPYSFIDKGIEHEGFSPDIEVRFKPMINELGHVTGVSCFRRNITEYINMIDKLSKNNQQFKDIAFAQSHHLRGPLTTIMGLINLLADENDFEKEFTADTYKNIKNKLDEMDKVIKEIIKLTK